MALGGHRATTTEGSIRLQTGDVPFRDPRFRRRPDDAEDTCRPPPSHGVAGGPSKSTSDNVYMTRACEIQGGKQSEEQARQPPSRQARRSEDTAHRGNARSRGASSAPGRGALTARPTRSAHALRCSGSDRYIMIMAATAAAGTAGSSLEIQEPSRNVTWARGRAHQRRSYRSPAATAAVAGGPGATSGTSETLPAASYVRIFLGTLYFQAVASHSI